MCFYLGNIVCWAAWLRQTCCTFILPFLNSPNWFHLSIIFFSRTFLPCFRRYRSWAWWCTRRWTTGSIRIRSAASPTNWSDSLSSWDGRMRFNVWCIDVLSSGLHLRLRITYLRNLKPDFKRAHPFHTTYRRCNITNMFNRGTLDVGRWARHRRRGHRARPRRRSRGGRDTEAELKVIATWQSNVSWDMYRVIITFMSFLLTSITL